MHFTVWYFCVWLMLSLNCDAIVRQTSDIQGGCYFCSWSKLVWYGMVIKARNYLNKSGLITIYYSFIYPYLTYCNHIWGCTYKTNLQRLVTLLNRIVGIIFHAKAMDSSHPLYTQLGIMKFSDLNTCLIARFMFRYVKASVPKSFGSLFQRNSEYHNHETWSADPFLIAAVTSDLGKTGIRFRGAII